MISVPGGLPPEEFSVCDCDRYAEHLADISVHRRMVVAAADVVNQFGVLLLRAGAPLGSYAFGKMRGHRLNRPVDEVLEVRRRLDPATLATRFLELLRGEPDLARIERHVDSAARIDRLCHTVELGPSLLQKLSVLEEALPRVFHRTLFTAWFGSLIATERALQADDVGLVFQAGLLHDLGLLHMDPALVDKQSAISADEWNTIQRHVLTGAIIAASLAPACARLPRLILQHHERPDGTGYPAGKITDELDPLGRIVALADMIHAVRFPGPSPAGTTPPDCLTYLRVNQPIFGQENTRVASRILRSAGNARQQPGRSAPGRPPARLLLDTNHSLVTLRRMFADARPLLQRLDESRLLKRLNALIEQLDWVSSASGIGNGAFEDWLGQSIRNDPADDGLMEIQATTRELFWLVRRIERQLHELLGATAGTDVHERMRALAHGVQFELRRAWLRFDSAAPGAGT